MAFLVVAPGRALESAARALLFLFCLITSVYLLLCHIPFTWTHFIKERFYPSWVDVFVRYHAPLYWIVLASCWMAMRGLTNRIAAVAFLIVHAGLGAWLTVGPGLAGAANDGRSLLLAFLAWEPVLAWEVLWFSRGPWTPGEWREGEEDRLLRAALRAALWAFGVYSAIAWLREPKALGLGLGVALSRSLLDHLLVFLGLFSLLSLARAAARLFPVPLKGECVAVLLLAGAACFLACRHALAAVSFTSGAATGYGVLCGVAVAVILFGQARSREDGSGSGLEFAAAWIHAPISGLSSRPWGAPLFLAAFAAAAGWWTKALALTDWNGLFQAAATLLSWGLLFLFFYARLGRGPELRHGPLILGCMIVAGAVGAADSRLAHALRLRGLDLESVLNGYAEKEISFRTARGLFAPETEDSGFNAFLQRNTNISRETAVAPPEIKLVEKFSAPPFRRPHIFLFVIDSLRQDYLGAYNPDVTFTPHLDAFAREAIVWREAFTPYGATGLSEPSIWTGAAMLHKHYVTPFGPLNSLEKLLEREGYLRYVTLDAVLGTLLKPSPALVPLDAETVGTYRFCKTLDELSAKLAAAPAGKPIFAYTQPQDIHVSVINREKEKVAKSYEGFHPPYASRVESMDACFGKFIAFLKRRGLYDDSVIIVTADHGDSLGEGGRWGHAYTIFPEVLRIPILMRVPRGLLRGLHYDASAPAFLTDLSPSLYRLLGHGPIRGHPLFGRSLFASTPEELKKTAKPVQVVCSSYAAVYGTLREGRWLYIADAVNQASHYFDLKEDPLGRRNRVDSRIEKENNALMRGYIEELNRFYGYRPP